MNELDDLDMHELSMLSGKQIARIVCLSLGTTVDKLSAKQGSQRLRRGHADSLAKIRSKAWWMMRQVKRYGQPVSYPEIAAPFGTRHTTVLEGVKRYERERAGTGATP